MSATFIIITGIPGSGKTTLLQEAIKSCPFAKHLSYGDAMLQEALGHQISRDELRKLPFSEQQEIGYLAAQTLAAKNSGIILLDTHALIKTPFGFCPGLPQKILQMLAPYAIAAIECDPHIIHQRRHQDPSRSRDQDTPEEIARHQAMNHSFLAACSALSGSLLLFIQNNSDPKQAAQPLIQTIQSAQKLV